MVSVMILLLGSQVQMYAQKKGGPDHKRPGMEMRDDRKPATKNICSRDWLLYFNNFYQPIVSLSKEIYICGYK